MHRRHLILCGIVLALVGFIVWRTIATSTIRWPQIGAEIVGSRVIRGDVPLGSERVAVMYKGEYHLRYSVESHDYYLWVGAGWMDQDRQFVADKVVAYEVSPRRYVVRYNPRNPAEAVAQLVG